MRVKRSLAALVLAAGRGARFGGEKLRAPWRDGTVLDGALAAAFAAPADCVTVVLGADEGVAETARRHAERHGVAGRLRVVRSQRWSEGLSASLKAGIAALPADVDAVYVFLGDMPRVPTDVLALLAEAVAAGAPAAVPTFGGEMGHPALIGASLFPSLAELYGDRGARRVLQALGPALAQIPAENDGVMFDVDTPDALAEA